MWKELRRNGLQTLSLLFSEELANRAAKLVSGRLIEQIRSGATDNFLELLLDAMDMAFAVSRSYRENIRDFSAKYVFTTADGAVGATARFENGDMHVDKQPSSDWTVRVQFKDAAALRRFLFSTGQDILDSLLANDVELDGNVNYVYKFGFMARDLERRLESL